MSRRADSLSSSSSVVNIFGLDHGSTLWRVFLKKEKNWQKIGVRVERTTPLHRPAMSSYKTCPSPICPGLKFTIILTAFNSNNNNNNIAFSCCCWGIWQLGSTWVASNVYSIHYQMEHAAVCIQPGILWQQKKKEKDLSIIIIISSGGALIDCET